MAPLDAKTLKRMAEVIASTANGRVRGVRALHQRKARRTQRETIVEGPTVFGEFIDAGIVPSIVLCTTSDTVTIARCSVIGIEPVRVTAEVLTAASDTRTPRSPIAVIDIPDPVRLRLHNTLVLVDIQDPGNVGTMIRSAAALGWDVAASGSTAEVWAPKTVRSAAGTHVHTRLIRLVDPVVEAAAEGLTTVATVVAGGSRPQPGAEPVALMIGSEAHGLPSGIVGRSDRRVSIAMPGGTESLNAAVAASIAMYTMMSPRT